MVTIDNFDFLSSLKTGPVFRQRGKTELTKDKVCEWQGEYTPECWDVIKEVCQNTVTNPYEITASKYTTDPFDEKYSKVEDVIKKISMPSQINESTLNSTFKSDKVISELCGIDGIGNITTDDITINYLPATNGTEQVPNGKDGSYSVGVKCHYGYSFSPDTILSGIIEAETYNDDAVSVGPLKSKVNNDGSVSFSGIIKGNYTDTTSVFAAAYENGVLKKINKAEIGSSPENKGKFDLTIGAGTIKRMFVWDGMVPVQNDWEFIAQQVETSNKANGVIISWHPVEGAVSYDVYRDGVLVAKNIEQTSYSDKFFDTIEGMLGETYNVSNSSSAANNYDVRKGEANKDYSYTVVSDNNKVLQSAVGRADAENKIAYITFNKAAGEAKTISGVNAGANGIRLVGTDAHLQTESNPSSLNTMRRASREIKVSADNDGYLKLTKTNYNSAMLFHNTAYNKGGVIDTAIGMGRANARTGFHLGNMITGEKAYKYKMDSEGYFLDSEGQKIKDISEAAFLEEPERWEPKPDVGSEQVFTKMVADAPFAVVEKFNDMQPQEYVMLMNAKFDRANTWETPIVNNGNSYSNAKTISGITVVESGEKLNAIDNSDYQYSAEGYLVDYFTYRFETEAKFDAGESLFGNNKIPGLIGPLGNEFEESDFNSSTWNIRFTSANVSNHYWIHSFAVIPASEYIK